MLKKIDQHDFLKLIPSRENIATRTFISYQGELGNFTLAVVISEGKVYAGVAKRNPCDCPGDAGLRIAATRAWRDFTGKTPGYSRQHPVSKNQAKRIAVMDALDKVIDDFGLDIDID